MNERVLGEERPIDTNISSATPAGTEERSRKEKYNAPIAVELNAVDGTESIAPDGAAAARRNSAADEPSAPLFPSGETTELRSRWDAIQVTFVDEPRQAVKQADALVAAAMKRLAEIFAEERASLEGQWDRGDRFSTEDLRLALRRYRSFFGRVLSV